MTKYILQRVFAILLTLFIIMTIGFIVVRMMPGSIYRSDSMSPEMIAALDAKYHLDKPVIVQYYYFLENVVFRWDWGTSISVQPKMPVWDVLAARVPVSMSLNIVALLISIPLGIIFGIVAANNHNNRLDDLISVMVVVGISVPAFVFASLLQYFIAHQWGVVPIIYKGNTGFQERIASMILPIAALSFSPIARITRYLRGELLESLSSEYMLLARTKGLTQYKATLRHAFRNSMVPLCNIIVPMFTDIVGGSLVIEKIFAVAGVGGLMVDSIQANDHSLTLATLIFYSLISLATVLITDLTYGIVDPRVRMGGGKSE